MDYSGCRPFSDEELDQVVGACRGRRAARDRLLIILGVYTGFRISEVLSICIWDVWKAGVVLPKVTIAKGFMKGRARSRTMPLHQRAREAIAIWVEDMPYAQDSSAGHFPLFPSRSPRRALTRRQASNIIQGAAERAGLDMSRVSSHSLRKSFARRMWASEIVGKDMARMARLLGHVNFSNTLRYLEFGSDLERAVVSG